jgi:hypothetical protein
MKWFKVTGFMAEVTKNGFVRSSSTKKLKNHYITKYGYRTVSVKDLDGKQRTKGVHQLVALVFIGPVPKGKEVNHKDLDNSNNYYKNLEYLTPKENIDHAWKNGHNTKGENNGAAKLNFKKVKKIRKMYKTNLYSIKELSVQFKISKSALSQVVLNKSWIR